MGLLSAIDGICHHPRKTLLAKRARGTSARIVLLLVSIMSATLLTSPVAFAAATDSTAVRFADNATLTLTSLPSAVVVVNESDRVWNVELTLSLYDATGAPTAAYALDKPVQSIGPGGSKPYVIRSAGASQIMAASGTLLLKATSADLTIYTSRPVTASPDASSGPQPEVKKLLLVSTRSGPFGSGSGDIDVYLPLRQGAPCPTPAPQTNPTTGATNLGQSITVSDGSRTALLKYRCVSDRGSPRIIFDGSHLGQPGNYTGTLKVGTTDVDIAVRHTTGVGWAIVTLTLGILLALLWHTWSTNRQPIRRADRRLDELAGAATRAQTLFEEAAAGTSYRVYQFRDGAQRRIVRIRDELYNARPHWLRHWYLAFVPSAKDQQDIVVDEAANKMAALDATIRAWPSLASDFAVLRSRIDLLHSSGGSSGSEPEDYSTIAPRLVDHAKVMLNPADNTEHILEADAAASLIAEVPATSTALALLPVAAEIGTRLEAVEPDAGMEFDLPVWARSTQLYRQARFELLEAGTAAAVARAGVDELLQNSRRLALQLVPVVSEGETQTLGLQETGASFGPLVSAVTLLKRFVARLTPLPTRRRAVGLVWVLLAFGIALWTGLTDLYLDKAWGTPRDYLAMLVWAVGVATVVPVLLTSLEDVFAGPLPLKKAVADANGHTT